MDLLATVRKEGSRGGRSEFQWSDVQNSSHREHYLGHSLMAPVGRWAKGRDLNWYAKGDGTTSSDEDPAAKAARERKEEIMRVKQAEEDALARALGLPVAPRSDANAEPVSNKREVDRVLQESAETDETATSGRGIGYGRNAATTDVVLEEKIEDVDIGIAIQSTHLAIATDGHIGQETIIVTDTIVQNLEIDEDPETGEEAVHQSTVIESNHDQGAHHVGGTINVGNNLIHN